MLFTGEELLEVVKPEDIRDLTGVNADDFGFESENPEAKLDELLSKWIEGIASHVHVRVGREFEKSDKEYPAIRDIIVRTVAKLVSVAMHQRTSPVVQLDEFAISILNTAEVTKDLDEEVKPFKETKARFKIFSSADKFEG